jgi:hypothetical protein
LIECCYSINYTCDEKKNEKDIITSLYEPKLLFDFKFDEKDFEIFKGFCAIKNLEITCFGDEDILKNLGYESYIDLFCKSFRVCTYKSFLQKMFKNNDKLFVDMYCNNEEVRDSVKNNPYIYDNLNYFITGIECVSEALKLYSNNSIGDEI